MPELRPGRSYLSIGEVLEALKESFPDVTISKIRFFEGQGLLVPERTPSGYRKFYPADVERLRIVLAEQQERFVPLTTARTVAQYEATSTSSSPSAAASPHPPSPPDEFFVPDDQPNRSERSDHAGDVRFRQSDDDHDEGDSPFTFDDGDFGSARHPSGRGVGRPRSGVSSNSPVRRPTVVPALRPQLPVLPTVSVSRAGAPSHDEEPLLPRASTRRAWSTDDEVSFSAEELVAAAGASDALLADAVRQGFVRGRTIFGDVSFDDGDRRILVSLAVFAAHGLDPRHVRVFLHAAQREADLYVQATLPLLRRRPQAGVSADDPFRRFGALESAGDELRSVVVHRALRSALDGTPGPSSTRP